MRMNRLAARALLAAGLATFVLPSCFTANLWNSAVPRPHPEPRVVAPESTLVATASDGSVTAIAVGLGAAAPSRRGDPTDGWLWLHDFDRPQQVTTFVRSAHEARLRDARLAV